MTCSRSSLPLGDAPPISIWAWACGLPCSAIPAVAGTFTQADLESARAAGIRKSFGSVRAVDDVSFDIAKATAFCLLGRSGTGKSVTIRHINGLEKPDKGDIKVFGESIVHLTEEELSPMRRRVAMLFQGGALFDSMNVEQNVAFPLSVRKTSASVARDKVAAALDKVRLLEFARARSLLTIAMTGAPDSSIARAADLTLSVSISREACPLNLAPTASTTTLLAVGDATHPILFTSAAATPAPRRTA